MQYSFKSYKCQVTRLSPGSSAQIGLDSVFRNLDATGGLADAFGRGTVPLLLTSYKSPSLAVLELKLGDATFWIASDGVNIFEGGNAKPIPQISLYASHCTTQIGFFDDMPLGSAKAPFLYLKDSVPASQPGAVPGDTCKESAKCKDLIVGDSLVGLVSHCQWDEGHRTIKLSGLGYASVRTWAESGKDKVFSELVDGESTAELKWILLKEGAQEKKWDGIRSLLPASVPVASVEVSRGEYVTVQASDFPNFAEKAKANMNFAKRSSSGTRPDLPPSNVSKLLFGGLTVLVVLLIAGILLRLRKH